jgi:extracellular elastinolytic metalloproteinase
MLDGNEPRQVRNFPEALDDYGLPLPISPPLPQGFPDDWAEADETAGNSVPAHLGNIGPTIKGTAEDGVLAFDPDEPEGEEQNVLNVFYFNCWLHDYFYLLGFRESDGNFQRDSFGRGGISGDRVDARAHPGPVFGTANMATPPDGNAPIMNMG